MRQVSSESESTEEEKRELRCGGMGMGIARLRFSLVEVGRGGSDRN